MHARRAKQFWADQGAVYFVDRCDDILASISSAEKGSLETEGSSDVKDQLNMQAIIDMFLGLSAVSNLENLSGSSLKAFETSTGADHGIFLLVEDEQIEVLSSFGLASNIHKSDSEDDNFKSLSQFWDWRILEKMKADAQASLEHSPAYGESVANLWIPCSIKISYGALLFCPIARLNLSFNNLWRLSNHFRYNLQLVSIILTFSLK